MAASSPPPATPFDAVFRFLEQDILPDGVCPEQWQDVVQDEDQLSAAAALAFRTKLSASLATIADAYRLFGLRRMYCSFNGGKEATLLLYLMMIALEQMRRSGALSEEQFGELAVHFVSQDEFPEILRFVEETRAVHQFRLDRVHTGWRDGIAQLVDRHPGQLICFALGTRRSDPNAGSNPERFEPSSPWLQGLNYSMPEDLVPWQLLTPGPASCLSPDSGPDASRPLLLSSKPLPPGPDIYMRLNPVLDWSYGDVWVFFRMFRLPYLSRRNMSLRAVRQGGQISCSYYCELYDKGYTSIGTMKDSKPNPVLELAEGMGAFLPAYALKDASMERVGRRKGETNVGKKNVGKGSEPAVEGGGGGGAKGAAAKTQKTSD
eukprot:g1497.t1